MWGGPGAGYAPGEARHGVRAARCAAWRAADESEGRAGLRGRRRPEGSEMTKITRSCGNVFADLGLPDAEELRAKADLMVAITRIVRDRKLTQAQAAAIAGVAQPKISAILN